MKNINLINKGFCQNCKKKLADSFIEGEYLRFCQDCKAEEYFDLEHFPGNKVKLNNKIYTLMAISDNWCVAMPKEGKNITLAIGKKHLNYAPSSD